MEAARFGNLVASITVQEARHAALPAPRKCWRPAQRDEHARAMSTLAIDVGGTKFSVAVFEGKRMVERESHATDREGGRDWMLAISRTSSETLAARHRFDCCGIGFGGPVDFERQRVILSTHVDGWRDFDLPGHLDRICSVLFP